VAPQGNDATFGASFTVQARITAQVINCTCTGMAGGHVLRSSSGANVFGPSLVRELNRARKGE